MYSVKEIFYTLQGEGANAGRPSVFCRFAGCNLWTGREQDRASAVCTFCDTDFVGTDGEGGGKFANAEALADAIEATWASGTKDSELKITAGDELKLVFPQTKAKPDRFEKLAFKNFYLQAMDGPETEANVKAATAYCLAHPQWKLSLQTHKMIGIA